MSVRPQAAGFERVEAGDGRAAGARDHVLEAAGVLARLEQELGRAVHGLRGEEQRRVAVEADLHAAVGERLDHEHDVRRAAAGEAGHGVEQRLVEHDDAADRLEERARDGEIVARSRACPRRSRWRPRATVAGVFGIARTTRVPVGERAFDRGDGHARRDRDDELVARVTSAADLRRAPCRSTCGFTARTITSHVAHERVVVHRRADAVRASRGARGARASRRSR